MAIDVKATVKCDMCGREEDMTLKESWRCHSLDESVISIVSSLQGWEFLDRSGYPIRDTCIGDGKILCSQCAHVYKDTIKRQREEMDSLFS